MPGSTPQSYVDELLKSLEKGGGTAGSLYPKGKGAGKKKKKPGEKEEKKY